MGFKSQLTFDQLKITTSIIINQHLCNFHKSHVLDTLEHGALQYIENFGAFYDCQNLTLNNIDKSKMNKYEEMTTWCINIQIQSIGKVVNG